MPTGTEDSASEHSETSSSTTRLTAATRSAPYYAE